MDGVEIGLGLEPHRTDTPWGIAREHKGLRAHLPPSKRREAAP